MSRDIPNELIERFDEVKGLYNLSDSDIICLTHIAQLLGMLGYPPKLMVKLLRALVTMWEMSLEHAERKK